MWWWLSCCKSTAIAPAPSLSRETRPLTPVVPCGPVVDHTLVSSSVWVLGHEEDETSLKNNTELYRTHQLHEHTGHDDCDLLGRLMPVSVSQPRVSRRRR